MIFIMKMTESSHLSRNRRKGYTRVNIWHVKFIEYNYKTLVWCQNKIATTEHSEYELWFDIVLRVSKSLLLVRADHITMCSCIASEISMDCTVFAKFVIIK